MIDHVNSRAEFYLKCSAAGMTLAQAAAEMGIKVPTVRSYAVRNRIPFADYAVRVPVVAPVALPVETRVRRDVWVIVKGGASAPSGQEAKTMAVSLPKPPFDIPEGVRA